MISWLFIERLKIMAESLKTQEPIAVANFVISLANEKKLFVTNLQLQKILFFLQGYTLDKYQVGIVNGSFSKWQYGPVQKNVYRTFRDYGASPITNEYTDAYFDKLRQFKTQTPEMKNIDEHVRDVLKKLVLKLLIIPVWKLIDLIHEDPSWFNYKDEIMDYRASDYNNEEIRLCFINSEAELK